MTRRHGKKINRAKALKLSVGMAFVWRFFEKIDKPPCPSERFDSPCWNWTGSADEYGYGRVKAEGKNRWAHRVSYAVFVAPIPAGHEIDHECKNPACVNPSHLRCRTMPANRADTTRRVRVNREVEET